MKQSKKICLFIVFLLIYLTGCDQPDTPDQKANFPKSSHHSYWLHDLQKSNDTLLVAYINNLDSTARENLPYELSIAKYLDLVVESIIEQTNLKDVKRDWKVTLEYLNYPHDMLGYIKEHSDIAEPSKVRLLELFANRINQAKKKNFNRQQFCIDLLILQQALLTEYEVSHKR